MLMQDTNEITTAGLKHLLLCAIKNKKDFLRHYSTHSPETTLCIAIIKVLAWTLQVRPQII